MERRTQGGRTRVRALALAFASWGAAVAAHAADVALAWDPSPAPAVAGYYVYYGAGSRNYTTRLDAGSATTLTVRNLPAGQTYYFAVTARDAALAESAYSNETSTTIAAAPAPTATTLASSANPSAAGASVALTASVAGTAPSGSVAFRDGSATIAGCASVPLAGSGDVRAATCTTAALAAGTHTITAAYAGDAANLPSTSAALAQVVSGVAATTTALASSTNPSAFGASVTFTANVTGVAPTGTVAFGDGGAAIAGCSAVALAGTGNTRAATCTTPALAAGRHAIVAAYAGDAANAASTSATLAQRVKTPTTTKVRSSASPAPADAGITFTATVSGADPTGSVAFLDGAAAIAGCGAVPLEGSGGTRTASCTSTLPAGTHAIVASYGGDADNLASASAPLSQAVEPAPVATFADVPVGHWAFASIEAVAYHGITAGCATGPRRFCPDAVLTRAEMAVFLERALHGTAFAYAPSGTLFADVPATHWAVGPIEQLHADAVTAGCAAAPLRFCPDRPITRAEMAILLLKAKYGAGYAPGPASGLVFADVPTTWWAAAWIERFQQLGFTSGCAAGLYCPDALVGRAEMAVFLQRVFALAGPPAP